MNGNIFAYNYLRNSLTSSDHHIIASLPFVLYKKLWNWKANGSSMGLRDVPWREICEEWGDCCDSQIARWMPQSVGRRAHRVQDSKAPPREWLPNIATKSKRGENQSSFFWHTHPLSSAHHTHAAAASDSDQKSFAWNQILLFMMLPLSCSFAGSILIWLFGRLMMGAF